MNSAFCNKRTNYFLGLKVFSWSIWENFAIILTFQFHIVFVFSRLVQHQVPVWLCVHHQVLLCRRLASCGPLIPFSHEEVDHNDVEDEKSAGDDDQPEGVAYVGPALGVPASVGHILSLEDVVLKPDVKLYNPGDEGYKTCKGSQRVPQHKTLKIKNAWSFFQNVNGTNRLLWSLFIDHINLYFSHDWLKNPVILSSWSEGLK